MSSERSRADGGTAQGRVLPAVERHFGPATHIQLGMLAAVLLALLTAPMWGRPYLFVLTLGCIWAILAMGWDIISGHTGYISFGHSALSGAGAYAMALTLNHVNPDLPLLVTLLLSVVAAWAIGMAFALPSLRLRGPYFSLMTLLAVLILYRLAYPFAGLTGGELGLSVPPLIADRVMRYYLSLGTMVLIAVGLLYVSRSNVGMVLVAIRDNEEAVEAAGLDTTKFKLWAFTLSSIPMGIGGAYLGHFFGNVDPETLLLIDRSIEMIVMSAIGGMGSILGPVFGAMLFVFLRDEFLLHTIDLSSTQRWVVFWALAGLLLLYAREGIFRRHWHWLGQFDDRRELARGTGEWIRGLPARVRAWTHPETWRARGAALRGEIRRWYGRGGDTGGRNDGRRRGGDTDRRNDDHRRGDDADRRNDDHRRGDDGDDASDGGDRR